MNLSTRQAGNATIVDVNGDITLYNAPQLRTMLVEQLKDKRAVRVNINLSEVKYIDSAGVASLVEGLKLSRELKSASPFSASSAARVRCSSHPSRQSFLHLRNRARCPALPRITDPHFSYFEFRFSFFSTLLRFAASVEDQDSSCGHHEMILRGAIV